MFSSCQLDIFQGSDKEKEQAREDLSVLKASPVLKTPASNEGANWLFLPSYQGSDNDIKEILSCNVAIQWDGPIVFSCIQMSLFDIILLQETWTEEILELNGFYSYILGAVPGKGLGRLMGGYSYLYFYGGAKHIQRASNLFSYSSLVEIEKRKPNYN